MTQEMADNNSFNKNHKPDSLSKFNVLVVDDEEVYLKTLKRLLRKDYNVITASSGPEALERLNKLNNVALIISDQRMPEMTGTLFLEKTIEISPDSIRFLITGYSDLDAVIDALNQGQIYRYISKPWNPDELLINIKRAVEHYTTTKKNVLLVKFNEELIKNLQELIYNTVSAIASALEAKDPYTYGHSYRVTYYSIKIGEQLGLEKRMLSFLEFASLLHDIGKIGIPEEILHKPSSLSDEEFKIIRKHPEIGGNILESLKNIKTIIDCVVHHHERFDGKGYPEGLEGEKINIVAKILAVADTYDAMTSDRPYRKGMSHETAIKEIKKQSGLQFDPEVVEAFLKTETGRNGYVPPIEDQESASRDYATDAIYYIGYNEARKSSETQK